MGQMILNYFFEGEKSSQELANGLLECRLCVALLHRLAHPKKKKKLHISYIGMD